MLIELFILLEVVAFIMLVLSFVKINDYRNWLLSFISAVLFLFLTLQSFQIQTENCRSLVSNSTIVSATVTAYEYTYDCEVNTFKDKTLSYTNLSFTFISLLWGLGNIFIKNWNIFG